MDPQIQYATTSDGVSIAYYTMGEGLPLVAASNVLWSNLNQQVFREYHRSHSGKGLGHGLQVVRYDARGSGLSDRKPVDFSMDARLLDLEGVVDHLKLARFALFGWTTGTATAIAYAVRYPGRVSHLILANPYARGRDIVTETRIFDSLRDLPEKQWERLALTTMANTLLGFNDSELARSLAASFRRSMTADGFRAFVASQDTIDVTQLLAQVAVPTLVMYRRDTGASREWSREVASKISAARFVEPADGRHGLEWTDEQTGIVEDFLGVKHGAHAPASPAGPVPEGRLARASRTILFSDIEGNTEILQRLGDEAWRAVLREHERITREVLRAHGGTEIKTIGDSFMASFDSATSAVECAIGMQMAFAARNESAPEPIRVRIGINAGDPIAEDDDLFGTAVTMAARIVGHPQGDEILGSEVVRALVAGKGFVFSDRGEFVMKGFDNAVRLYEVRWRG